MAKKTIQIDIFICDHVDEEGNECENEGERNAIKQCAMCQKDLCSRHYEYLSVTSKTNRVSLSYYFCFDHAEEFMNTLIDTFGDTRPVAYAGMAK